MKERLKKALSRYPALTDAVYRVIYAFRDSPFHYQGRSDSGSVKEVFSGYFADNFWADAESVSGPGSNRDYTAPIRDGLPDLLRERKVGTLLDAPCGDFHWMREVVSRGNFAYIGGDIVPDLIARLNDRVDDPRCRFEVIDVTGDALPGADMWMCRDCFIHLPLEKVKAALGNFYRSGIPYLLTTQYDFPRENRDIEIGGFRCINLRRAPFGLPAPEAQIYDFVYPYPPRKLALWHRDAIPKHLRDA